MLALLYLYACLGFIFGVCFIVWGVQKIDPVARGTGIGFRLLVLPGATALWPLLLARWLGASRS